MSHVARRSDVVETHAVKALSFGLGAVTMLIAAIVLFIYRGQGMLIGLVAVLFIGALVCGTLSVYWGMQIRKVGGYPLTCVYCQATFDLLTKPDHEDVTCPECHRLIPVENGEVLPVAEVRCGFCNALNYYSRKSTYLICEQCDHEIPISVGDELAPRHAPAGYVVIDDNQTYSLRFVGADHAGEDLVQCLQHMLALNRGQVKQIIAEAPTVLLTGITRKKAELLAAQIATHGGKADFEAVAT